MPIYILLSTLSQQGVQTLRANPDRLREVGDRLRERQVETRSLRGFDDEASVLRGVTELEALGKLLREHHPPLELRVRRVERSARDRRQEERRIEAEPAGERVRLREP